jgi:uncharacterized protein (TIGR03663 family)
MKRAIIIICWICVVVTGSFLRFDTLEKRPFHADEATGARITARRMENGGAAFDPRHFHGPLLADLAIPACRAKSEGTWKTMTKTTLRTIPAVAGVLLVCVPLFWRGRLGDGPALLAAALLATSPLLVYYSRMFIHEIPLALCGMLVLTVFARRPLWVAGGFLLGAMFALKESVAISVFAWMAAALWVAVENRSACGRDALARAWREWRKPAAAALVAGVLTAGLLYTDFLRHPRGAVDALRTFFVYETVGGHEKGVFYYAELLLIPRKSGGVWWFESGVSVLAVLAYASTFTGGGLTRAARTRIRFVAYAAVFHFLIYSLFAYKTPWLACLPWAHVCLLAGASVVVFTRAGFLGKSVVTVIAAACLFTQFRQARAASGRFASNAANPYAYVPTQRDVESIGPWLGELARISPGGSVEPLGIVGTGYWPLPWYLRDFDRIGYWPAPSADLAGLPVVFATDDAVAGVSSMLSASHTALPRGLRDGAPLVMFVRNDLWNRWMEGGGP